jgi:phospholipase C
MGATGINWQVARHVRAVGRIRGFTGLIGPVIGGGTEHGVFSPEAAGTIPTPVHLLRDGRMDLVGFGDTGVWTALANGDGTFRNPQSVVTDLGYNQGWRVDQHPRFVADVTGDGRADLIGFGNAGVHVARSEGDGTFAPTQFGLSNFGVQQGWRVDMHPRFVADITGDGRGDLIAFGNAGVWIALSNGNGTFKDAQFVVNDLGYNQGWRVGQHPRFVADITGDGRGDLIAFGDAGVWVALSNGDGTFQAPQFVLANFGVQQGWRVDRHPRFVADVTGDGKADLVGFGDAGAWVALSNGDGTFRAPELVVTDLGYNQEWRVDQHPRFVADVTGDGKADLVGFGNTGVHVSLSNGDGTFQATQFVLDNLGVQQGWQVDKHPRFVADVTGEGRGDLVGFGEAGVWVARSNGNGTFQAAQFALADFGTQSGTSGISHVFVLMLENRSFDHMLGFSPISGTDAVTGRPTATVRLQGTESNVVNGTSFPVTQGADNRLATGDSLPGHEFEDVIVQLCGPSVSYHGGPYPSAQIQNSGYAASFAAHKDDPAEVMKCFAPGQLPILNQLAREFAICDHWFSSLPGPTFPNRFFAHAASSGGLDHSPTSVENVKWEFVDGFDFPKGSIYDAMDRAHLGYRFYADDHLPVVAALNGVSVWDVNEFGETFTSDLASDDFKSVRYIHIEPSYDVLNQFQDGNSQHPEGDVQAGEQYIKRVYEAIRNSPVWESSVLIITWDEHGGFFEHVTPPAAIPPNDGPPEDDDYNQHGFLFDRLGPRVPALVISPLIPKNVIDHRVYDHASIPAMIERMFGIDPLTDRDRLVNAPNTLLTFVAPRTDTPATLAAGATPSPRLAAPVLSAEDLARPVQDAEAAPFLQIAVIQDAKMAPPAQRRAVVEKTKSILTVGQAHDYISQVIDRVASTRAAHRAGILNAVPVGVTTDKGPAVP